jgi:large subunit ribosomal protein L21
VEGTNIYAIIETGGKQYRVTQGQTLDVDNLNVIDGVVVELDKVLLIGD